MNVVPYSTGSGVKSVVVRFATSISFQLAFQITSHWGLSYFTFSKTASTIVKKRSTVGFYITSRFTGLKNNTNGGWPNIFFG